MKLADIFADTDHTKFIAPDTCEKIDYTKKKQALAVDTTKARTNAALLVETNFGVAGCHLSEDTLNSMIENRESSLYWRWTVGEKYSEAIRS